jgi:protein gp37
MLVMAGKTAIEWSEFAWNPIRGCSRVSPGCGGANHQGGCYAEKIAARFSDPGQPFHGFAERTAHGGRWTGKLDLVDDMLTVPLRWKKPRRIFVNSMSDLFHENLPDEAIDKVFAVMALAPQHTFQVLTKRADRMLAYFTGYGTALGRIWFQAMQLASAAKVEPAVASRRAAKWPLPHVWLGVSVEDQERADERIPDLLATPATVRFLSCEPLLGPVDLRCVAPTDTGYMNALSSSTGPNLDWIIAGGESGPRARPSHPDWFRSLRDQCAAAVVPFFFKQWGEWRGYPPTEHKPDGKWRNWNGGHVSVRVGKKAAGATLDGREHRECPR